MKQLVIQMVDGSTHTFDHSWAEAVFNKISESPAVWNTIHHDGGVTALKTDNIVSMSLTPIHLS